MQNLKLQGSHLTHGLVTSSDLGGVKSITFAHLAHCIDVWIVINITRGLSFFVLLFESQSLPIMYLMSNNPTTATEPTLSGVKGPRLKQTVKSVYGLISS